MVDFVDFDVDYDSLDFRAVVESLGVADDPFGEDGIAVTQMDADTVITDVSPLSDIQHAFESLDSSPTALKSLIKIGDIA